MDDRAHGGSPPIAATRPGGGQDLVARAERVAGEGRGRMREALIELDQAIDEGTRLAGLFRGLLESSPDALVVIDEHGAVALVNARTESLFGYARGEVLGQPVEQLVPERFHSAHERHRASFMSDARRRAMGPGLDLFGVRKDGSEFPVEISLSPVDSDEGTFIAAAIRDVSERKRAEAVTARLAAIVESSDDAVIGKTLDGTVLSWNPGAERMYGYSPEEALGQHISFLSPPGHADEIPAILERLARGERVEHFDSVQRRQNGSEVGVSLTVSPVLDASGTVVGASMIARDVTERRRASERFRALLESGPDAVVLVDEAGRVGLVNTQAERLLGYHRSELLGLGVEELLPERFRERHPAHRAGYLTAPRTRLMGNGSGGVFALRRDGSEVPVEISISPLETEEGMFVAAAIRDVTDRMTAEAGVRELAAIVDFSADAITGSRLDGTLVSWNSGAERLFGYRADEVVGRPRSALDELLYPPDRVPEIVAFRERLLRGESVEQYDTERLTKDGRRIAVTLTISPVLDASGTVTGFASVARDISERKREEDKLRRSRAQLARSQEIAHLGSWEWDLVSDRVTGSDEFYRLLGVAAEAADAGSAEPASAAEASLASFIQLIHPDDREAVRAAIEQAISGREPLEVTVRIPNGNGTVRILRARGEVVLDERSEPVKLEGTVHDVTERERAGVALERAGVALAHAEERFRLVFEEAPLGVALIAPDLRVTAANGALCALTGYAERELEARALPDVIHPDDVVAHAALAERLFEGRIPRYQVDQRYVTKSGEIVWVSQTATLIHDGEVNGLVIVEDISERKRFEGRLQHLADHDSLTGLFSRRRFYEEVDRELAASRRYGSDGAVLLIDLDHFKYVNDRLGHSAGDELLAHTSTVLQGRLRGTDILGRLGGDEFGVALPHATVSEARRVADGLLAALSEQLHVPSPEHERAQRITGSIGIAPWHDVEGVTSEDLLAEADIAMYAAKEEGRNRAVVYDRKAGRRQPGESRLSWAERLQSALERDQFVLHAQPIVGLDGQTPPRHELLLRLRGENDELIPPRAFLYVAERFGLIEQIDGWVIRRAIALLTDAQRAGDDLRVNVNLSARSIGSKELQKLIEHELRTAAADPRGLCVEITETAAIRNVAQARLFARHLRALGCELALDDFGAGFASFYYLKHFEFDYLKIDGEFIKDLPASQINQLVVKAVVEIARGLGKRTIAEFVIDPQTIELLRDYGVDFVQGFYIARPAALDSVNLNSQPSIPPDATRHRATWQPAGPDGSSRSRRRS